VGLGDSGAACGLTRPAFFSDVAHPRFTPLILWLLLAVAGCSLPGPVLTLEVDLPPLPPAWAAAFGEPGFHLQWRASSGSLAEARGAPWVPGPCSQSVTVAAGAYVPVLAWVGDGLTDYALRPAGAVSPLDVAGGDRLVLSFEQGAAAYLVNRLLGGQPALPPEAVDVRRIADAIQDAGRGDPWQVDLDAILVSLADGKLECRTQATAGVVLPTSALAAWPDAAAALWASPFLPRLQPEQAVEAAIGFHRLHLCDGTGRWTGGFLDLWVAPSEILWLTRQ
jgi:hypothetical protein